MMTKECSCGCGSPSGNCAKMQEGELENYMFMGNLRTIKRAVDAMLEMDPAKIDAILKDGHDWAADHIATSKDDIEEVASFLMNQEHEESSEEHELPMMGKKLVHTFESYISSLK